MITRLLSYLFIAGFLFVGVAILFPIPCRSRGSARRASCQSNLKQIGFALKQYAQDNDDRLPVQRWTAPVAAYSKYADSGDFLQCPETPKTAGTSDYFFNVHLLKRSLRDVSVTEDLSALVLLGEGQNDAPLNTTLAQFPDAWRKEEKSPLWRHLEGADYGFADGHVKWLKPTAIGPDFKVVKR